MDSNPKEPTGAKLYKELLACYKRNLEGAQRDMNTYACNYADKNDPVERGAYLAAKAKVSAWNVAIEELTRIAGVWMRLDYPASQ